MNRSAILRAALRRTSAPVGSVELARLIDRNAATVGALLKHDLAAGRVVRERDGYRWRDTTPDRVTEALRFLASVGVEVSVVSNPYAGQR